MGDVSAPGQPSAPLTTAACLNCRAEYPLAIECPACGFAPHFLSSRIGHEVRTLMVAEMDQLRGMDDAPLRAWTLEAKTALGVKCRLDRARRAKGYPRGYKWSSSRARTR